MNNGSDTRVLAACSPSVARPSSRLVIADSVAMVVFFTATGILNERLIAGMEWSEVTASRLLAIPLMLLTARAYGIWRDAIMRLLNGRPAHGVHGFLLDTVASLGFNIPIYAAVIAAVGASTDEIISGCLGMSVFLLFTGRVYGLWLDWVQSRLGIVMN